MAIQIYNTLTKKKEEFRSLEDKKIRMYMCGPTVYDYFHIGNARSFIMSDVIRRYFEYRGYDVIFIMNLTDVDDRIIKKANEQKITSEEVAKKYSDAFFEDIEKLNIKKATVYPKATDNIKEMLEIIQKLIHDDKAYILGNDVYFNIDKFEGYGKLSGKNIDDLIAGARVDVDELKKNPLDFALWKGAKEGEPFWESPYGNGRPGWHIECSAMAMRYLGETIDIHCGGNDLIFPHHENEIAQSEGSTGKPFAKFWIHFGFLNINNEKMSKSLGNFFTTREILHKYPSGVLRFYYLLTHYSSPLNFTEEGSGSAKNGYERLHNLMLELARISAKDQYGNNIIDTAKYEERFVEAMDDDFNTPKAMAAIFDLTKEVNTLFASEKYLTKSSLENIIEYFDKKLIGVFGIFKFDIKSLVIESNENTSFDPNFLENFKKGKNTLEELLTNEITDISDRSIPEIINALIEKRKEAKQNKNWASADKIRNELKNIGVLLEDKKDGSTNWKI